MFGAALEPGQQVRAVRDVKDWLGCRVAKRGQRGIVRKAIPGGWFSQDQYEVEFADGLFTRRVRVKAADVRRRAFDTGESGWKSAREWQVGMRLGLFVAFGLPALFGLARYFLFDHGTASGLIAALPGAALGTVVDVAAIIGPLGVIAVLALMYLRSRARS
jgi:hypothetical protein